VSAAPTTTAPRPSTESAWKSTATGRRRLAEEVVGTWIPIALVVVGAGLRIRQYTFRRSL